MKRASYREAVTWIAWNDEPTDLDPESVAQYVSTMLIADVFAVEALRVGRDVVRKRKQIEVQA